MDDLDRRILRLLEKDGRMPFVKVAAAVGLTEGAVRVRVGKLLKEKVIKRFTVETDAWVKALLFVQTEPNVPTTSIAKRIATLGVVKVYEVSGDDDIVCFLAAGTVKELNLLVERIRKIRGVRETRTSMVLK